MVGQQRGIRASGLTRPLDAFLIPRFITTYLNQSPVLICDNIDTNPFPDEARRCNRSVATPKILSDQDKNHDPTSQQYVTRVPDNYTFDAPTDSPKVDTTVQSYGDSGPSVRYLGASTKM